MSPRQSPAWPFTQSDVTQPPAEFSRLAVEDPVLKVDTETEDPVWLLTRYEDIRAVISDLRFKPRMPVGALDLAGAFDNSLNQDEPGHTRLRKLVSRQFTPRKASHFRPSSTAWSASCSGRCWTAGSPPTSWNTSACAFRSR